MSNRRKFLYFLALVLLPAIAVGISNIGVFPDTYWIATIMLAITVIVAGLFTWHARNATAKTWRYVTIFHLILCCVLCANLVCHWLLAREVNAARDAVKARHTEEDRAVEREERLNKSRTDLITAERKSIVHLPFDQRKSTQFQSPPAPGEYPPTVIGSSEEDVKNHWWWWLTYLAIAEVSASVFLGAILMCVWEWDRNKDGIPDHLQQLGPIQSRSLSRPTMGFGSPPARIPAVSQDHSDPKS